MPHFAKIENGIVTNVIVIDEETLQLGHWGDPSSFKQTSYNSRGGVHYNPETNEPSGKPHLRFNYAGLGYSYDAQRDAFIPPKPFDSWVLNESTCLWDAPTPMPTNGHLYTWDESTVSWKEVTPPSGA